ncbi:2-aminoethylphosphonate ABC transporter permease subunit [Phytomonospora endophytica]|uniref:2-aminoethylphosphonate transport system permease protein n=1 Tax=Phytomonospora endophytica TaxID=714109 RepID=A0A841FR01_9ACTN|nr:2-aminoethylphosphonate ABC transporter permease subunit [Phytomonospora endophytica]MBB6035982.1 2-aminoethylphosphonate transport system permease protein [Phytomonospora endophytica]GIG66888.1 2-aminoethylphosphonate ABC transporter permease [Phytomonospora endophytica]
MSHPWRRTPWLLPPLLLIAGFFLYPLYFVVRESLTADSAPGVTLATWQRVLTSGRFLDALGSTVTISLAATVGCVVLGTFFATVLAFVPFPGAGLVTRLVDTLLAFPSFLIALAFTFLYGSAGIVNTALGGSAVGDFLYSPWCVIAAEITFYTPFVMRPLLAAYSHVPREQLDVAASLGARPGRVFARIVLPEALPALAAGGCLTLLLTLNEFGIVLFIGAKDVTTLPMLVHSYGVVTFDLPAACVVAVIQVALSSALYAVYRRTFHKGR